MFPQFKNYEPFTVRAVMQKKDSVQDLLHIGMNKVAVVSHKNNLDQLASRYDYVDGVDYILADYSDSSEELKKVLDANRIGIAPAAHTYSLEKAARSGERRFGQIYLLH
jgi:hypothetical protein